MQSLPQLQSEFAIDDALRFDEPHPDMLRATIATQACTAELYLHGAHLTAWQPQGVADPVLFLSPRSSYTPAKAIRGGIPIIFPWFGARSAQITGARTDSGQHGFARTSPWTLAFAAMAGDDLRLLLTLEPDATSRAAGFDSFRAALEITFGRALRVQLSVLNTSGDTPLVFEEALHTYLHVGDVRDIRITGLHGGTFIDKTDGFARKSDTADPLVLHAETDRAYVSNTATVRVEDPNLGRALCVAKHGSDTTVVWNPWSELAATLNDLGAENASHFVCVEAANALDNRITLAPAQAHAMGFELTVEPLG